jgi:hypothetical protein
MVKTTLGFSAKNHQTLNTYIYICTPDLSLHQYKGNRLS